jgi:hypothetical protein
MLHCSYTFKCIGGNTFQATNRDTLDKLVPPITPRGPSPTKVWPPHGPFLAT